MFQKIQKLIQKLKEKGQGAVEYALILGFVAVIVIYMMNASKLESTVEQNVSNANAAGAAVTAKFATASATGT